jgi:hypothetical protein
MTSQQCLRRISSVQSNYQDGNNSSLHASYKLTYLLAVLLTPQSTLRPLYAASDELTITRNFRAHIPYRTLSKVEEGCGKFQKIFVRRQNFKHRFHFSIVTKLTNTHWHYMAIAYTEFHRNRSRTMEGADSKSRMCPRHSLFLDNFLYLHTYLRHPWSRVLFEKLTGFQLV